MLNDDKDRADIFNALDNTTTCLFNRMILKSFTVTIKIRTPSAALSASCQIIASWKLMFASMFSCNFPVAVFTLRCRIR